MQNKQDIINRIRQEYDLLNEWLIQEANDQFDQGPAGKWTTGQHVDHLIKSSKPLNTALRLPKFLLQFKFGKNNRENRSFDEVVAKYQSKLELGGKASGRYLPKAIPNAEKEGLLLRLKQECNLLCKITNSWSEKQLDKYILPHPLIGKMTVRELLYFTIYHVSHHRKTLVNNH